MQVPRLVLAATHSGAGKTTLATALAAAFCRAGLVVQPFKVGPDYIDPGYHTAAAGRTSRNLDSFFLGPKGVRELFMRAARGAELCLVEGVMGLYDGRGAGEKGSTAEVAKILEAPVVLIMNAGSLARSAAAVVLGYRLFDPRVRLAGVILNGVGSERHYRLLREAVEGEAGVPVVGYCLRREEISLPQRHLGLLPAVEKEALAPFLERLAELVSSTVDLTRLLEIACSAPPLEDCAPSIFPRPAAPPAVRLGVVKDAAFHFYYQDGLDLLAAMGAELVFVSALDDPSLPADLDGLYIGGGYPEMFLERLAGNRSFMDSLRRAFARGMPLYAECGGMMYLCRAIVDFSGREYPMVGLIPGICRMARRREALGYVEARVLTDNILAPAGARLVGHEFHYSYVEGVPGEIPRAYLLYREGEESRQEGYVLGNLLASYLHLHFAACPEAARRFLASCRAYREKRFSG